MSFPRTTTRLAVSAVSTVIFTTILYGCGGGTSSASGGGGGGGGHAISISLLSPSSIMTGVQLGLVKVFGKGFSTQSQVLIDGVANQASLIDFDTLEVQVSPSLFDSATGIHQFAVQGTGGIVSNSLPFTIYSPQPGPDVLQALPGFLVGDYAPDPRFITVADLNGDGLSDVVMPGPALINSPGSIAIFYGQADGSLSAVQYILTPVTPYALAAGDVNGDGNADLIAFTVTAPFTITVTVLLGDGHGGFQQTSSQQTITGDYPGPAYLSDVDGDGIPDLVLGYQPPPGGGDNLVWLKNTSGGKLAPPVMLASYSVTYGPFLMATQPCSNAARDAPPVAVLRVG